jgi:hypothetical protein
MPTMPSSSPTVIRANAWEREALRVLALADRLGIDIRSPVLVEYGVRDLQRLQAALEMASEKPGWWRRLRLRSTRMPFRWLLHRALPSDRQMA